jgi:hypothetical protein
LRWIGIGTRQSGCRRIDDLTDATTQAIRYLRDNGLFAHRPRGACLGNGRREAQTAAEAVVPLLGLRWFIDIFAGQKRQRGSLATNGAWLMSNKPDEETTEPLIANDRNYFKVEKWAKDGSKVERMLYAGNSLLRAESVFEAAIKHRPRIRLTIRQRTRVLRQWPKGGAVAATS